MTYTVYQWDYSQHGDILTKAVEHLQKYKVLTVIINNFTESSESIVLVGQGFTEQDRVRDKRQTEFLCNAMNTGEYKNL